MTIKTFKPKTLDLTCHGYGMEIHLRNRSTYTYYQELRYYDLGQQWPKTFTTFSGSQDSVNSHDYWIKKKVRVQWRPSKFNLEPPVEPRVFLPSFPPYPVRKEYTNSKGIVKLQSPSSWNKRLQLYRKRYDWVLAKRVKLLQVYDIRMAKYRKRLVLYEIYASKAMAGVTHMRRMRNTKVKPNNPYSRTWTVTVPMTGYYKESYYSYNSAYYPNGLWWWNEYNGNIECVGATSFPYIDAASLGTALLSAESRVINKLYGKLNQWNLHIGNIVAERHQSLAMIKSVVDGIALLNPKNLLRPRSLKNIDSGIAAVSKNFHNGVLMTTFGVLPLLQDAYSAGTVLAKLNLDETDRVKVKAVETGTSSAVKTTPISSYGTILGYDTVELTRKVKVSYVLEYDIQNGVLNALQGLGLVNPAEIAWEVLPWSFVVDWFIPIGNYINSLTADAGLSFRTGTKVVTTTDTWKVTRRWTLERPTNPVNGSHSILGGGEASRTTETKVRTVLTTAPTPRLPRFKNPVTAYHLVEAISLLFQRFK